MTRHTPFETDDRVLESKGPSLVRMTFNDKAIHFQMRLSPSWASDRYVAGDNPRSESLLRFKR